MKNSLAVLILCATALFGITGCDDSEGNESSGNTKVSKPRRVDWEAVSSDFNPRVDEISFWTDGIERIQLDVFGFTDEVEVIYSPNLAANEGFVRLYRVWKRSASWGDLRPRRNGGILELKNYGSYQCSIQIRNGRITELEGGCHVRVEIHLPRGAEVEVYNVGELITRRFIPISTDEFLYACERASFAEDKFKVIADYLSSYEGLAKRPSLTSEQLGEVIDEFMRSEDKFKALRQLHRHVSNRDQLGAMIEREFSYFDRPEARRIVGL